MPEDRTRSAVRKNRSAWQSESDEYERLHRASITGANAMAWGLWRIPESELHVLGEVGGKDLLELGCGAATWSLGLATLGARPIGLDFSSNHLAHAVAQNRASTHPVPLVEGDAERLPFKDESFDVVFCDWGAMTFANPYSTVPEAARVLRPGGLFAFATHSPIHLVCHVVDEDRTSTTFQRPYFGLERVEFPDTRTERGTVDFSLPYGEWVRLFRENALTVEDLIETRPSAGAKSSYRSPEDTEWARSWPMESIWRLRKTGGPGAPRSARGPTRKKEGKGSTNRATTARSTGGASG